MPDEAPVTTIVRVIPSSPSLARAGVARVGVDRRTGEPRIVRAFVELRGVRLCRNGAPLASKRCEGACDRLLAPVRANDAEAELVRREVDQKTVFEKSYKVEANTAGGVQAPYQIVTEPVVLPLTRPQLNDDYSIFVGFDNGKNVAQERPSHHRKPKQKEASSPAPQ